MAAAALGRPWVIGGSSDGVIVDVIRRWNGNVVVRS